MTGALIWFTMAGAVALAVAVDIARTIAGKGSAFDPPALRIYRQLEEDRKRRWNRRA